MGNILTCCVAPNCGQCKRKGSVESDCDSEVYGDAGAQVTAPRKTKKFSKGASDGHHQEYIHYWKMPKGRQGQTGGHCLALGEAFTPSVALNTFFQELALLGLGTDGKDFTPTVPCFSTLISVLSCEATLFPSTIKQVLGPTHS